MTVFTGENYTIDYDEAAHIVAIAGTLRLNGIPEYGPIVSLLSNATEGAAKLVIDLSKLDFLNSSGIAVLSKFVIEARNRGGLSLAIVGAKTIPWQGKSLQNLKRLMPALELEFR